MTPAARGGAASGVRVPESPYVGLVPFAEEDHDFFYGRDRETRIIGANLRSTRLTLLYGSSGVGKSSVLSAGVVRSLREEARAALAERGSDALDDLAPFCVAYFRSWRDPPLAPIVERMRRSVVDALGGEFVRPWSPPAPLLETLHAWSERVHTILLVLDQFEDYLLYHPDEHGPGTLATELAKVLNDRTLRVNVLISIREDAWAKLDRFEDEIPKLYENYLRVDHLDLESARRAIEGPVEHYSELTAAQSRVEPELVHELLRGGEIRAGERLLGQSGVGAAAGDDGRVEARVETPYLQLVLKRLWASERHEADGSRVLRRETLRRLGGPREIVQGHLRDVMDELPEHQQAIAERMFHHLVTPSKTKIAHSAADLADYAGRPVAEVLPVLERLAGEPRIQRAIPPVTGGVDDADRSRRTRYEIFHDVLADAVLDWRDERRKRRLEQEALAKERRLAEEASARERRLAQEALEKEQRLAEEVKRERHAAAEARERALAQRRLKIVWMALAGVAAICVAASVFFLIRSVRAEDRARAGELAERAQREVSRDPELALLLARRAQDASSVPAADEALRLATAASHVTRTVAAHDGPVIDLDVGADGRVASAGDDGVRVWRLDTGESPRPLGPALPASDVDLSPSGARLLVVRRDRVEVLDSESGKVLAQLPGPTVRWAQFADDRRAILVDSLGSRIWDTATNRRTRSVPSAASPIPESLAPDGRRLVDTGPPDPESFASRGVRLLDIAGGRPGALADPSASYQSASFSSDGRRVVLTTVSAVKIWNPASGDVPVTLRGSGAGAVSAAFSPDGSAVAAAAADGAVRVWELASGERLPIPIPLRGHVGGVTGVAFAPDGDAIVTAGADGTIRLWRPPVFPREVSLPVGQLLWLGDSAADIIASDTAGQVRVWTLPDARPGEPLRGVVPGGPLAADGSTATIAALSDGRVRVWDGSGGRPIRALPGRFSRLDPFRTRSRPRSLVALVVSSDGTRVVARAGEDLPGPEARDELQVWSTTGSDAPEILDVPGSVDWRAYSPVEAPTSVSGAHAATAGEGGTVLLWKLGGDGRHMELTGHSGDVTFLAFSPDGRLLASSATDGTVRVWVAETGRIARVLRAPDTDGSFVYFSSDARFLLTTGPNGSLRVFDAETGRAVTTVSAVPSVGAVGVGGSRIAIVDSDGRVYVTPCEVCGDIEAVEELAEKRADTGRELTPVELDPGGG